MEELLHARFVVLKSEGELVYQSASVRFFPVFGLGCPLFPAPSGRVTVLYLLLVLSSLCFKQPVQGETEILLLGELYRLTKSNRTKPVHRRAVKPSAVRSPR